MKCSLFSVVYAVLRLLQYPHNNRAKSVVSSKVLLMGLLAGALVGTCGLLNLLAFFVSPPILREMVGI